MYARLELNPNKLFYSHTPWYLEQSHLGCERRILCITTLKASDSSSYLRQIKADRVKRSAVRYVSGVLQIWVSVFLASKLCDLIWCCCEGRHCLQLWASQSWMRLWAFEPVPGIWCGFPFCGSANSCLSVFLFSKQSLSSDFGLLSKLWISARSSCLVRSTGNQWATTASSSEKGQGCSEGTDFLNHIILSRKKKKKDLKEILLQNGKLIHQGTSH